MSAAFPLSAAFLLYNSLEVSTITLHLAILLRINFVTYSDGEQFRRRKSKKIGQTEKSGTLQPTGNKKFLWQHADIHVSCADFVVPLIHAHSYFTHEHT